MSSARIGADESGSVPQEAAAGGDEVLLALRRLPPLVPDAGRAQRLRERCRVHGFETNTGTLRDTLTHEDAHFAIELFHLSVDAHDQARFSRRRSTRFDGEPTCIPTPEDVIVTKLRWARPKDVADIRDILRFMEPAAIDWTYLHRWATVHGTREALDAIRASVSTID